MKLHTLATAATLSLFALGAFAQAAGPAATPRIDARQAKQEQRIDQGVASGQLTPRETKRLEGQQARIDRVEDKAKADGVVTPAERARVTHMQNKASRNIHHQKHDLQKTADAK